jgi:HAD superfamily hydrolase (TIGR01509 family)
MVRAVLFDLFETLITESGIQPTRASSLGAALGLPDKAFRVAWRVRRPRVVVGQLSFGDALTEISRSLIGGVNSAAVEHACEERAREKASAFAAADQEIAVLVSELRERGLSLAVISNCLVEDVRAWPLWPLARHFKCPVFSCAAGVRKPDPEIYLKATRGLGVEPGEAIFVGDGGDDELSGAEGASLRAFRADWFSRRWPNAASKGHPGPGLASPRDVLTIEALCT